MSNYNTKIFYNERSFIEHCVDKLAELACDKGSENSSIAIVCKSDEVQNLFKQFSSVDMDGFCFDYGYMNYSSDDYDKECVILIYNAGILCLDTYYDTDDLPQRYESDLIYIHENCNSKVKLEVEKYCKNVVSFGIGLYE